jgi:lipoprotein-anchoring transpeptidase ErfK/SrfK
MADAGFVAQRRLVRVTAAVAVLPALWSGVLTDAARADDGHRLPAVPVAAPTTSTTPTTTPITTPITTTPTLRLGARGADVLRLQRRLRELGYDVGKVHSGFGDDTLHAVRAFQKVQGMTVDGVVTAATWTRLADPVVPRARFVDDVPAVEVDLTTRVLYLTRGGAVTAVFDVSPGKRSTPTVTGQFTIYRQVNRWDHGPLGGLYRPKYFHRGFALHGSLSVPTYSASHGCVRLTTAGMDRLWPQLSIGEKVSVYRS